MAINVEFIEEVGAFRWLQRTLVRQFSKRVLHTDNTITLPTGLRMRLPRTSKFATEIFITDANVDWGSEKVFASHLDASGVVLDVGANVGYYSLYLLPMVAAVHGFEPDPRALFVLQSNLAGHPNAHAHSLAMDKRPGKARFTLASNSEVSHLADSSSENIEASYEVDVTTIDDFVAENHLAVTGIKIDVEGADIHVIEGGLATLRSQFPLVLTESNSDERLFDLVCPLGYRIFAFAKQAERAQFVFREIVRDNALRTKMLFLVPPKLQPRFEGLVSE